MMKEDVKFNTAFVRAVERNPCLYDYNNQGYFNRLTQDESWTNLSIEMRGSVEDCKTRWKNLRASLTRYLKAVTDAGNKHVKPYYLVNAMQFLMPFLKPRKKFAFEGRLHSPSTAEEPEIHILEDSRTSYNFDPGDEEVESQYSNEDCKAQTYKTDIPTASSCLTSGHINDRDSSQFITQPVSCNNEDSLLTLRHLSRTGAVCAQRERERKSLVESTEDTFHYSNPEMLPQSSPDLDFYKSLLPDLQDFTPHYKRKFKQSMLQLIDDFDDSAVNSSPEVMPKMDNKNPTADLCQTPDKLTKPHNSTIYADLPKDYKDPTKTVDQTALCKVEDSQYSLQHLLRNGINYIHKRKRSTIEPTEVLLSSNNYSYNANHSASDADLNFFRSTLPDIANFNPHLKRKFKRRVLQLLDDFDQ